MYENKLEFLGARGVAKQKTFRGGSMDIFWNCTMTFAGNVTGENSIATATENSIENIAVQYKIR